MKVYVDKRDKRSDYLIQKWIENQDEITEEISESDLAYLGIFGLDYLKSDLKVGAHIYCLSKCSKMEEKCLREGCYYHCISSNQEFITANTITSVDAFIGYFITEGNIVSNHHYLLLGNGNLAKRLNHVLLGFTKHVSVCDDYSLDYPSEITVIINTVPSNVIRNTKKGVLIYDLASKPYGLKEVPENITYRRLPSLPTYYHTPLASKHVYDAIMKRDDLVVEE